jgi:hypothetical protein
MSTQTVEVKSDDTNISLEEQAKQVEQNQTLEVSEDGTRVEVKSNDETSKSTDETRPEWLPEKFASAEDLAKAYSELEKKQSSLQEPTKEDTQELSTEPSPTMEKFYTEYSQNGELSEKSYEELSKMGLDKNLVDGYIAGQQAIANSEVKMIHDTVGGEENYSKVIEYAKNNLTEAEQNAFNETLDTGSIEQVKFAVQAIANRAGISGEQPQQMINGDTNDVSTEVFESVAQVTEAMNDPRYANDPAYRKQVELKLAKSSVF